MVEGGGNVGFGAFDHIVVGYEVGEDVAVEAVGAGGVEAAVGDTAGCVDCREGVDVEFGCDGDVEGGEVLWRLDPYIVCVNLESDAWIQFVYLSRCCWCSLFMLVHAGFD